MAREDLKLIQTTEEAKKLGRNGGIASGKARREKRTLRKELELLLEMTSTGKKTNQELISLAILKKAKNGDTKAFEIIRDTIGQKPIEQIQEVTPPKIVDDI